MHQPDIIVRDKFRRNERMRIALISAWCNLTFAAKDALRADDRACARRYAENARELVALFGEKLQGLTTVKARRAS